MTTAPVQAAAVGQGAGPLAGLNVAELGQLIGGPFAARTRADFGAALIKIEPPASGDAPGGHPLRQWRLLHEGTNVWWQVQSRNEQSVALDLKDAASRALVRPGAPTHRAGRRAGRELQARRDGGLGPEP